MGNLQLYSSIGFFEVAKNMEDMPSLLRNFNIDTVIHGNTVLNIKYELMSE